MAAEEDIGRLSVGELKRRLRWCGAPIPTGHLEKSDLVCALRDAMREQALKKEAKTSEQDEPRGCHKAQSASASPTAPQTKPPNSEQKQAPEQQAVVDLHVLSEEDLRQRLAKAGVDEPAAGAGKFYLVSLLKNAIRSQERLAEQLREDRDAAAASAKAEQNMMRDLRAAAAAEEVAATSVPAVGAAAAPPPPPPPPTEQPILPERAAPTFDDRDPGDLSAAELRRRLEAYGSYGRAKLRGLAERHEFVAALREAIVEKGPHSEQVVVGSVPQPPDKQNAAGGAVIAGSVLPNIAPADVLHAAAVAGRAAVLRNSSTAAEASPRKAKGDGGNDAEVSSSRAKRRRRGGTQVVVDSDSDDAAPVFCVESVECPNDVSGNTATTHLVAIAVADDEDPAACAIQVSRNASCDGQAIQIGSPSTQAAPCPIGEGAQGDLRSAVCYDGVASALPSPLTVPGKSCEDEGTWL